MTEKSSFKMYLLLHVLEELLPILSLGSSVAQNKNLRSDLHIMSTLKIQTVKLQLIDN